MELNCKNLEIFFEQFSVLDLQSLFNEPVLSAYKKKLNTSTNAHCIQSAIDVLCNNFKNSKVKEVIDILKKFAVNKGMDFSSLVYVNPEDSYLKDNIQTWILLDRSKMQQDFRSLLLKESKTKVFVFEENELALTTHIPHYIYKFFEKLLKRDKIVNYPVELPVFHLGSCEDTEIVKMWESFINFDLESDIQSYKEKNVVVIAYQKIEDFCKDTFYRYIKLWLDTNPDEYRFLIFFTDKDMIPEDIDSSCILKYKFAEYENVSRKHLRTFYTTYHESYRDDYFIAENETLCFRDAVEKLVYKGGNL